MKILQAYFQVRLSDRPHLHRRTNRPGVANTTTPGEGKIAFSSQEPEEEDPEDEEPEKEEPEEEEEELELWLWEELGAAEVAGATGG